MSKPNYNVEAGSGYIKTSDGNVRLSWKPTKTKCGKKTYPSSEVILEEGKEHLGDLDIEEMGIFISKSNDYWLYVLTGRETHEYEIRDVALTK